MSKTLKYSIGETDVKDAATMVRMWEKQNINFLEMLFTHHYWVAPEYEMVFSKLRSDAETIANYNNYALLAGVLGVAHNKYRDLLKTSSAKSYVHIARLHRFLRKWEETRSFYLSYYLTEGESMLLREARNWEIGVDEEDSAHSMITYMTEFVDNFYLTNQKEKKEDITRILDDFLIEVFNISQGGVY